MRKIMILAFLGCAAFPLSGCEKLMGGFSFTAIPYVAEVQ
jgi:hypothetical protein